MSRLVNIPPLQSVTEVGATTDQATTYTGGLYSDAVGTNSFNFGRSNTTTGNNTGAVGYNINFGSLDTNLGFGRNLSTNGIKTWLYGETLAVESADADAQAWIGGWNTTYKQFGAYAGQGFAAIVNLHALPATICGTNIVSFGLSNAIASAATGADESHLINVFGQSNTVGLSTTRITIFGRSNSATTTGTLGGTIFGNSNTLTNGEGIIFGLSNTTGHSAGSISMLIGNSNSTGVGGGQSYLIGNAQSCSHLGCLMVSAQANTSTASNEAWFGGTSALYKFPGTFADNDGNLYGTGKDAKIYYDGTDLVIDPDLVGSGVVKLGASSNNHLQCDKIGLGTTAYSANNVINYNQSGGSRIVLNFQLDFTGTFTNPATIFAETTYSGTGATSSPTNIFSTKQNTQKTGTFSPVIARNGFATGFGVTSAVTIDFNCLTADWNGNGTGHSAGTIRRRGFICSGWGTPTGVSSLTDWGGFTDKDWCLADNTRLYFEGSVNTKGDTYMVYTSASSALDTVVNGTNTLRQTTTLGTWADAFNFAFGTTTGTKIGTATTQKLGFWNVTPVAQYATTGTSTGFTAGAGTNVQDVSTFTGNTGSTAYTIGDIVRALKLCGVMAA